MLERFQMEDSKPAYTPLPEGLKLISQTDSPAVDSTSYCELVGCLLYYTITRADLQFAIGLVSRFMVNPQKMHLDACLHILRYVKHTINYGIYIKKDPTTICKVILTLTGEPARILAVVLEDTCLPWLAVQFLGLANAN